MLILPKGNIPDLGRGRIVFAPAYLALLTRRIRNLSSRCPLWALNSTFVLVSCHAVALSKHRSADVVDKSCFTSTSRDIPLVAKPRIM
jgi:hypothetical protein